ncbi:MAG: GAF domain-containing protein [Nitrospirae bacterium]|nr:GAF domain-containing protein [Nitrospirota bacterium]
MNHLLPKTRTILERGRLLYQPFGKDQSGKVVGSVSGLAVIPILEVYRDVFRRRARESLRTAGEGYEAAEWRGEEAAREALERLAARLNEAIDDPRYQITVPMLLKKWNYYSGEFYFYLCELAKTLSGDPDLIRKAGMERTIHPAVIMLGKGFSLEQVHQLLPYFVRKYAMGTKIEVLRTTPESALIRYKGDDQAAREAGEYLYACLENSCDQIKHSIAEIPKTVYGLSPSSIRETLCITDGHPYCEWEYVWRNRRPRSEWMALLGLAVGIAALVMHGPPYWDAKGLLLLLASTLAGWFGYRLREHSADLSNARSLSLEQQQHAESQYRELQQMNLDLQQANLDLRRRVGELTALHEVSKTLIAHIDPDALLEGVLRSITRELGFDRGMILRLDEERGVLTHGRGIGDTEEMIRFVESLELPVDALAETRHVIRKGEPLLVEDIHHPPIPLTMELVQQFKTRSFLIVPLRAKDRVIGALAVDNTHTQRAVGQEDLRLLETIANQVAVALVNAESYQTIRLLNKDLEEKIALITRQQAEILKREKLASAGILAASLTHDLKTPLAVIKSAAQMLQEGVVDKEVSGQMVEYILAESDRLTDRINSFLSLSRQKPPEFMDVGVEAILDRLLWEWAVQGETASGIRVVKDVDSHLPQIRVDPEQVRQAFWNLLVNAKEAMGREGEICIAGRLSGNGAIEIRVTDTGSGLPDGASERIFEPFYSTKEHGTGLGLTNVRNLIEANGGKIAARNRAEGRGAEFTISLPFPSSPSLGSSHLAGEDQGEG